MIIFWFLKEADVVYRSFPVDQGGTVKSVIQYFQETWVRHPAYLPAVPAGWQSAASKLPSNGGKFSG